MRFSAARLGRHLALLAALGLIVVGVVAGWRALGQLAISTDRALAQTERALDEATAIADSSEQVVRQLRDVLALVGTGLGDTSQAVGATAQVSASLRSLLDSVSFIGRVDELTTSLQEAEVALDRVRTTLRSTAGEIGGTLPAVDAAARSLSEIPPRIDASLAEVRAARADIIAQRRLWRLALLSAGAALIIALLLIGRVAGRLDRLALAVSPPPASGGATEASRPPNRRAPGRPGESPPERLGPLGPPPIDWSPPDIGRAD